MMEEGGKREGLGDGSMYGRSFGIGVHRLWKDQRAILTASERASERQSIMAPDRLAKALFCLFRCMA